MLKRLAAGVLSVFLPVTAVQATERPGTPIALTTALSQGVLEAGKRQTLHLRIGLKGIATPKSEARPPMNIAIVIDRSGSMQGPRIVAAREAAIAAIERLSPRDIISVVSYDDRVEVEVPATRATDPARMKAKIAALTPRGSTAIWAGLQKGAEELRKFKSRDMVNKIILLSDGLANVGPTQPAEFVRLGTQLAGEGITVSTIGLGTGYNEDLMAGLARAADGTHKFVAEPADLAQFFAHEFDDAANVVAQDVIIEIECGPGVMPQKSLGRSAEINGSKVTLRVNQIIAATEQSLLVGLDVPAGIPADSVDIAKVKVSYNGLKAGAGQLWNADVKARVSASESDATSSVDKTVMHDVTLLIGRDNLNEALKLRDAGRHDEARQKFDDNAKYIDGSVKKYSIPMGAGLSTQRALSVDNATTSAAAPAAELDKKRKILREQDTNQAGAKTRY